ncbi:MAG: S1 RNA-binding domain-containing protein [Candidatus Shikimatogenerans sp. AspAUS03]|uniref:S1 RNA-binding domain-containing protein n=1 Tax=Candidatus Shikimatogenerans sp. AspAUS03 TaxID=3158563 RepID=A0AAU7QT36_9FLAO
MFNDFYLNNSLIKKYNHYNWKKYKATINFKQKILIIKEINKNILTLKLYNIYRAIILEIKKLHVIVYINNNKYENSICIKEFKNTTIKKGDIIIVLVIQVDSNKGCILSYKEALRFITWKKILQIYKRNKTIKGYIYKKILKGYIIKIKKYLIGYLPNTQIDKKYKKIIKYNGLIKVKIININYIKRNIIVSNKEYYKYKKFKNNIKKLKYKINSIIKGKVKKINKNIGIKVILKNKLKAILLTKDISWTKSINYKKFKLNKNYKFKILNINSKNKIIKLGYKQKQYFSWKQYINKKFKIGDIVYCKVKKIQNCGIIVELLKYNIKGIVILSEMNWVTQSHIPKDFVTQNQKIKCLIIDINYSDKKLFLSIKRLLKNPWINIHNNYIINRPYEGIIQGFSKTGNINLSIDNKLEGIINNNNIFWKNNKNIIINPEYYFFIKQKIYFILLRIDNTSKRLYCSYKYLKNNIYVNYKIIFKINSIHFMNIIYEDNICFYLFLMPFKKIKIILLKNKINTILKMNDFILIKIIKTNFKKDKIYVKYLNKNNIKYKPFYEKLLFI